VTATLPTADGEFEYEPTARYVLSRPDEEWCYAIVRTADGEVLGVDGWQQTGVVEDASFTRDLAWILPELNRLAERADLLGSALEEVTRVIMQEAENHRFGGRGYDPTLDHLYEIAESCRQALHPVEYGSPEVSQ
jgi:hypothetical protein